jgi:hypothetical protein
MLLDKNNRRTITMENFEPENAERFMADQQVGMFLNRYRECVSSDDYDKLLALYRQQRIDVLEEAAKYIENGSSFSGWAESGLTFAKWIRSLGSKDPISEKYGTVEIK